MIQSAAYDIIKHEGIMIGREEGMIIGTQEMVIEALEERFGVIAPIVIKQIKSITIRDLLKKLLKCAIKAKDIEEFKEYLKTAMS